MTTDPATRSYKLLVIAALASIYAAALYAIASPPRAEPSVSAESAQPKQAAKGVGVAAPAAPSAGPAVRKNAPRVAEATRPRSARIRTRSS